MDKTRLVNISFITNMEYKSLTKLLDALMTFDIPEFFEGRETIMTVEEYKE